jgi:hypothetical protein
MPASVKKPRSQFDGLKALGTGTAIAEAGTITKIGRPLKPGAKSRDTAYRAWGGYLKIDTLNEANYELGKLRAEGRDMSDLLEELLSGWVAKQREQTK